MGTKTKTISKFVRIGTEGATTDGRKIDRAMIEQMAATYDPKKYGARINLEHIKGILPEGPFKAYGDVIALKTQEIQIDGVSRLTLLAQLEPTEALIALNKDRQKVYTSMEVQPNFAGSGKFYLRGLAVTDDPASLGTEMLEFSAKAAASPLAARKLDKDNLFSAAEEVSLEFEEIELPDDAPSLLTRIKSMFAKTDQAFAENLSDVHAAVEQVATHQVALEDKFAQLAPLSTSIGASVTALNTHFTALEASHKKLTEDFTALNTKIDTTPAAGARPPATGSNGAGTIKTDC